MESTYKQAFSQTIEFFEALEKEGTFSYYLVGGILVNLYSDFRITRDIDVVIELKLPMTLDNYISLLDENNFEKLLTNSPAEPNSGRMVIIPLIAVSIG